MIHPKYEHWTFAAFWIEPWQKADIIAVWSGLFSAAAIVVALGLALWEHRRSQVLERARRLEFRATVTEIVATALEELCLCRRAAADEEYKWFPFAAGWNRKALDAREALSALVGAAPPDAALVMLMMRAIRSLKGVDLAVGGVGREKVVEAFDKLIERLEVDVVMLSRKLPDDPPLSTDTFVPDGRSLRLLVALQSSVGKPDTDRAWALYRSEAEIIRRANQAKEQVR